MSTFLITLAIIAAPVESEVPQELRSFHEISQDIRDVLREESRAESKPDKAKAIHRMTDLYLEVKRDPRLETSNTLKSYKAKLWSRLTRIKKALEREFALKSKTPLRERQPRIASAATQTNASELNELANEISDSLADQLGLVGGTIGGPSQFYTSSAAGAARGGGAMFDYGPDLVDLIERTIQPDFWDTNGGPGSIFYYRPLHALVVRATSEVHHSLGGLLDGIRRVSN